MRFFLYVFFTGLTFVTYAQSKPPVNVIFESQQLKNTDFLRIKVENHDTVDYWYHIQIYALVDTSWIIRVSEGQQSFYKTGTIESNKTLKEKLSVIKVLGNLREKDTGGKLKVTVLFSRKGVHVSDASPLSQTQYIDILPSGK